MCLLFLIAQHSPAAHFAGGWYDFFLRETLSDFERCDANWRAGDAPLMLTIGPWFHFESLNMPAFAQLVAQGLDLFDTVMKSDQGLLPKHRVNLFVMEGGPSVGEWRYADQHPQKCQ